MFQYVYELWRQMMTSVIHWMEALSSLISSSRQDICMQHRQLLRKALFSLMYMISVMLIMVNWGKVVKVLFGYTVNRRFSCRCLCCMWSWQIENVVVEVDLIAISPKSLFNDHRGAAQPSCCHVDGLWRDCQLLTWRNSNVRMWSSFDVTYRKVSCLFRWSKPYSNAKSKGEKLYDSAAIYCRLSCG